MGHLVLSIVADELAALERAEQEMRESHPDPAYAGADPAGSGVHPAVASRAPAQRAGNSGDAVDTQNPPPGWIRNESLGRWLNPLDAQTWGKVPRNAVCPCGSGKKYKHCHGQVG